MSIHSEITRLSGAKADIKAAIEGQGVTIPSAALVDDYPEYISQIGGAVDLSHRDVFGKITAAQNTANSYVVKTAGTYKIPLVYGNGIKNSAVNSAAYTRQGTTYTADFVNHLGNTLTSPYIEANAGCTPASVGLLWQTTAGMITSVSLVDGFKCHYLQFTVASVPTTNGLAVLWVKDGNGDIMWSWTIWCCNNMPTNQVITNYTGVEYEMLGLPMGAIYNAAGTSYTTPHFQYGRKDAMPQTSNLYDINGNTYSDFGNYGVASDEDQGGTVRSIANSIKLPNKFFLQYDSTNRCWCNNINIKNYWNANQISNQNNNEDQDTAIKTIYDPCPVGYMIPSARYTSGFTKTGAGTTSVANINAVGNWSSGWRFMKNSSDTDGVFFRAAGYRDRAIGSQGYVGTFGYWYSYSSYSDKQIRYMIFYSTAVYPSDATYMAVGFSIWPTKELN